MTIPNLNNKLLSDVFIHITKTPTAPITESGLPLKVEIEDPSGQIKFSAELITFARCKPSELGSIITYASHGIDRDQFLTQLADQSSDLAVYVYRKIQA